MLLESPELNPIKIGCINTPERSSYFCKDHSGSKLKFFYKQCFVEISEKQIVKKNINRISEKMNKIWDIYIDDNDVSLYLCEFENNKTYWITEDDIKLSYLQDYYRFKKELEIKFKNELTDLSCNTLKKITFPCEIKCKTRGLFVSAYNCGIINGYREIFGSESISQVLLFYLDIIENAHFAPDILIYDDGCHLKKFIEKNQISRKSERAIVLDKTKILIDKFHINNHTDKWCLKNCNPNNEVLLDKVNTVVCEEINFWLSGYKHMVKHMKQENFGFFIFIIMDFYNRMKLNKN